MANNCAKDGHIFGSQKSCVFCDYAVTVAGAIEYGKEWAASAGANYESVLVLRELIAAAERDLAKAPAPDAERAAALSYMDEIFRISHPFAGAKQKEKHAAYKAALLQPPARGDLGRLKRTVGRIPDGYDTEDDPYDLGWNNAINKIIEELEGRGG